MPMNWTSDADAKLFAVVLATSKPALDYDAIAEAMGPECTKKAIIHRIGKIREKAKAYAADGQSSTTPTATPKKRNKTFKTEKAESKADEEEDEEAMKPKKKRMASAKKSDQKVKVENVEDDDSEDCEGGGVKLPQDLSLG